MTRTPLSKMTVRSVFLTIALLQPASGMATVSLRMASSRVTRGRIVMSAHESGSDIVHAARDELMRRTVEQQISSFAAVGRTSEKTYLVEQWQSFINNKVRRGMMTHFLSDLQRQEPQSLFVPKRSFRGLSPGNPYAASQAEGHYEEVRPMKIALRLIKCREQLAEDWLELLPSLSNLTSVMQLSGEDTRANATVTVCGNSLDKQLLLGISTKLAGRQMLHDLSMRPSCEHLHEWLASYLFVQHAVELTVSGSVEKLHSDLVSQPICFRGKALVDPLDLSTELFQRSTENLEHIEIDLQRAPEHIVPLTAGFFESCLRLDE